MEIFLTYIAIILIILVTLTIHELGHFFAAKKFNVNVKELSIGIGPKLFQATTKNSTVISLRLLPVMAYVLIDSHAVRNLHKDDKNSSKTKRKYLDVIPTGKILLEDTKSWQYYIIMLSGVFLNLITFFIGWLVYYLIVTNVVTADGLHYSYVDPFTQFYQTIVALGENMILNGPGTSFGQVIEYKDAYTFVAWLVSFSGMFMVLNLYVLVFNILPFPPLDGYKCLSRSYKNKTGNKVSDKIELGFMIFVLIFIFWATISSFIVDFINASSADQVQLAQSVGAIL